MNSWMENAACRNHLEPEMWFSDNPVEKAEAKRICAQCPVRNQCKTYADNPEYGIWAGHDYTEQTKQQRLEKDRIRRETNTERIEQLRHNEQLERAAYAAYKAGDRSATTIALANKHKARLERKKGWQREARNRQRAAVERYKAGDRDDEAVKAWVARENKLRRERERAAQLKETA